MNKEKLSEIIDRTIKFLILVAVFFIPLYFNLGVYSVFEPPKAAFLAVAIETAAFFWLIKIFIEGKVCLLKNWKFYLSLGLIATILTFAAFFSGRFAESFFGSYWRNFGLFTYFNLFLAAFLVFNLAKEKGLSGKLFFKEELFFALAASGVLAAVYGLIQVAGFDFLRWEEAPDGLHDRASSALGQPNFLAAFLLFSLPVMGHLFFKAKKFFFKFGLATGFILEAGALYFTYSRGVWIGAMGALALLSFLLIKRRKKILYAAYFLLCAVLAAGIFLTANPSSVSSQDGLSGINRLKSLADLSQGSAGLRFFYYRDALKIISGRPWLGFGPDTQTYQFYRHYQPEYAIYETINRTADRAHNGILDTAVIAGMFGAIGYGLMFFFLGRIVWRCLGRFGKDVDATEVSVLFFGLSAFLISEFFSFASIPTAFCFWVFVALIFSSEDRGKTETKIGIRPAIGIVFLAAFFALLVFSFVHLFYGFKADRALLKAKKAVLIGEPSQGLGFFAEALSSAGCESKYATFAAADLLPYVDRLKNGDDKKKILIFLNENLEKFPENRLTFEGRLYRAAVAGKIEALAPTEAGTGLIDEEFSLIAADAPGFARIYYDWGNFYFDLNDFRRALEKYYFALEHYPALDHPHLNDKHQREIAREKTQVLAKIATAKKMLGENQSAEYFEKEAEKTRIIGY